MKLDVFAIDGEKTVHEAVMAMRERNQGCVAVLLDAGEFGIVTERDVMFRVLGDSKNPKTTKLKDVVTKNPITVSENSSLELALKIMRDKGLRRLIVTDEENKPVGAIDQRMFFSALVNALLGESEDFGHEGFVERLIRDVADRYSDVG